MQDGLQQALHGLATHNIVARDIIILCAGALIFLMAIAWVIALMRRRTTVTLAAVGHVVVLGVLVMRLVELSLDYYLENVGVPFLWVDLTRTVAFAVGAMVTRKINERVHRHVDSAKDPAHWTRLRVEKKPFPTT